MALFEEFIIQRSSELLLLAVFEIRLEIIKCLEHTRDKGSSLMFDYFTDGVGGMEAKSLIIAFYLYFSCDKKII